ncbi:hypothetical protein CCMSSC00406_0007972 [Pleurotus cornucopiae]|uniref:Uncharacterized protein n=1 Tax=Pleurotus cornucopiae TaxID=5321 RepID=A0ACB7IJM5_PLECO|nr:hypothetical protein CCMSSC00406_0007972 [Pleurotus cornucopiae]
MVSTIPELIEYQWSETCLCLSSIVILVYEYTITLDLEVSLIWFYHSSWSWTSALFMVNRYLPFIVIPNFLWLIITIRTWAVWEMKRKVAIVVAIFFLALWTPSFIVMWRYLESIKLGPTPYPGYYGCSVTSSSQIMSAIWALLMTYETSIVVLMVYRGSLGYHKDGNTALFNAVYRDGIIYYLYVFVVSLVNVIVIASRPRYILLLASDDQPKSKMATVADFPVLSPAF